MPPLPSTTQSLATRLNALLESNKATTQLIQRLSKLDFQPGSLPSKAEGEEGDARIELSAEIHDNLKALEDQLELLRQEVEDVSGASATSSAFGLSRRRESAKESERSRLTILLARLTEDLKLSRTQFRKAQITAKRNADRAKLKERELLFSALQSGTSSPSSASRGRRQNNPHLTENELIASASSDVTAALRRTHQLMQSEVSRSRFAQETLEQSTAALADLGEKYTDLNTLLANSRTLVTTLLKSTKSDTWYLETTLYILITTVIWLIFRRWFYGPLSWFVIWPLKLAFRVLFAVVPAASVARTAQPPARSATSLIVKPSAQGDIPKRPFDANEQAPYVRVGGGGRGYNPDPSPPDSHSQRVGQMAEQQSQSSPDRRQVGPPTEEHPQLRQQGQRHEEQDSKEPVIRGDGTVLQESNRPRNPKKKMWEEDVERKRFEEKERQQQQQLEGATQRREKDEL